MTMRILITTLLLLLGWSSQVDAANLCVKTGGSDATVKASINYIAGNEAGSTCWQTIGRATWGNANRTTGLASGSAEAAAAGDTVYVFGGTYSSSLNCSGTVGVCKFTPLYDTTNSGSVGSYITFACIGDCLLTASTWNGPAVGANSKNYIKWYADISLGYSWIINAYAPLDNAAASNQVDITADTGPVTCSGATGVWLEGFDIDGGNPGDPYPTLNENYTAFRFEHCTNGTIRNSRARNFSETGTHAGFLANYHSTGGLFEHNDYQGVAASDGSLGYFIVVKDNVSDNGVSSYTARYNRIDNVGYCFGWSITDEGTEPRTLVYQNICTGILDSGGSGYAVYATGNPDSPYNVDIMNNTFIGGGASSACLRSRTLYNAVRFWNNICSTMTWMIVGDTGENFPASEASLDLEHNDYYNATTIFYSGPDGNRNKASFDTAYNGQHDDSPASIETDPRFANAAGGDYRLCTAAATPHASCAGASPAINLGVDALDLDSDTSTVDNINAGAEIGNGVTIGLDTDGGTDPEPGGNPGRSRVNMRRRGEDATLRFLLGVVVLVAVPQ